MTNHEPTEPDDPILLEISTETDSWSKLRYAAIVCCFVAVFPVAAVMLGGGHVYGMVWAGLIGGLPAGILFLLMRQILQFRGSFSLRITSEKLILSYKAAPSALCLYRSRMELLVIDKFDNLFIYLMDDILAHHLRHSPLATFLVRPRVVCLPAWLTLRQVDKVVQALEQRS